MALKREVCAINHEKAQKIHEAILKLGEDSGLEPRVYFALLTSFLEQWREEVGLVKVRGLFTEHPDKATEEDETLH